MRYFETHEAVTMISRLIVAPVVSMLCLLDALAHAVDHVDGQCLHSSKDRTIRGVLTLDILSCRNLSKASGWTQGKVADGMLICCIEGVKVFGSARKHFCPWMPGTSSTAGTQRKWGRYDKPLGRKVLAFCTSSGLNT